MIFLLMNWSCLLFIIQNGPKSSITLQKGNPLPSSQISVVESSFSVRCSCCTLDRNIQKGKSFHSLTPDMSIHQLTCRFTRHAYFKDRLKRSFQKNKHLSTQEDIEKALRLGEFVYKEMEALWFLKKYRAMKKSYYE